MSRCADPTCWPIEHDTTDHTNPSGRVKRWLERGQVRPQPKPDPERRAEPVQEVLDL